MGACASEDKKQLDRSKDSISRGSHDRAPRQKTNSSDMPTLPGSMGVFSLRGGLGVGSRKLIEAFDF